MLAMQRATPAQLQLAIRSEGAAGEGRLPAPHKIASAAHSILHVPLPKKVSASSPHAVAAALQYR